MKPTNPKDISACGHWLRYGCLVALWLCAGSAAAQPTVFHVDTTEDDVDAFSDDALCRTANGQCSLRAAVQEANRGSIADVTIVLPAGLYRLTRHGIDEDDSATGDLDIQVSLNVVGAGSAMTVIDGDASDFVIDARPRDGNPGMALRTLRLQGLTLTGAVFSIPPPSGAFAALIVGDGVQGTLRDVVVRDNATPGIDNRGCLEGFNVRVVGNARQPDRAMPDGGLVADAGGVTSNGDNSCLLLEDSEVSGNGGNGIGAAYGLVGLRRVLVSANADIGILLNGGRLAARLENVTVSNNGTGILNDGGSITRIRNSTIADNRNLGILDAHGGTGEFVTLTNTVLAGNNLVSGSDTECLGSVASENGGNLIERFSAKWCNGFVALPGDQLNVDAGLSPLDNNGGFTRTHRPGPNLIDRGVDEVCSALDQRRAMRPADGDGDGQAHCDIGAFEASADRLFVNGFDG